MNFLAIIGALTSVFSCLKEVKTSGDLEEKLNSTDFEKIIDATALSNEVKELFKDCAKEFKLSGEWEPVAQKLGTGLRSVGAGVFANALSNVVDAIFAKETQQKSLNQASNSTNTNQTNQNATQKSSQPQPVKR